MGEYCSQENCSEQCDLGECYCDKHLRSYIREAKKEEKKYGKQTRLSGMMKFPNGYYTPDDEVRSK